MAIAFVQDILATASSNVNVAPSRTGVTAGNKLIIGHSSWKFGSAGTSQPSSVSSSPVETWANDANNNITVGGGFTAASLRSAEAGSSGTYTVTFTFNSATWSNVNLAEYSGVADSSPLDVSATNTGTNTSPTSGTTSTTTQADTAAVAVFACASEAGGDTNIGIDLPTNYTNRSIDQSAATVVAHSMDDRILSATGTQSASWGTLAGTGPRGWVGAIAVYKAASTGGSGSVSQTLGAATVSADSDLYIKGTLSASVG